MYILLMFAILNSLTVMFIKSTLRVSLAQHAEAEVLLVWTVDLFAVRDAALFRVQPMHSFQAKCEVQEKATADCVVCSRHRG